MPADSVPEFPMPFVSVREKILTQQRMISDEGVGNNTRGRVCSPCFSRLIALQTIRFRKSPLHIPLARKSENSQRGASMKEHSKTYDALIVGGGHNGLVAACYLAKAGKSVLLLEAHEEMGGATTSVKPFPDYDARLSRYSYLVSLLPDQIVADLGIRFRTLGRPVASYTPYRRDGRDDGLLVASDWDEATAASFRRLTGSDREATAWRAFYDEIAVLAQRMAPSMLQPLKTSAQLKEEIAMPDLWHALIERPIGEIIRERFADDIVRGVVLTDALIGTFVSADDMQANRCFLYHLIGNGNGQWRVPQGGMGALVNELHRVALDAGVEIRRQARVVSLESGRNGVQVETADGTGYRAKDLLFAAAPQLLARLRGETPAPSLEGSQLKINMLLTRLPRLKSGMDPRTAFAGTFHVEESYTQLETAYAQARGGIMPQPLPLELYCHTLTDPTILSDELNAKGFHTLTLFGLHTPAALFDADPTGATALAQERALAALNQYLLDPIESVLAPCSDGTLAIEAKSPLDLEKDIFLPRGNIFHRDLDFPFLVECPPTPQWGAETDDPHIYLAGAGARRGGGVSGIAGHNAAMALLAKSR
jgi:phytoene dehydrogenase-like protein